MVWPLSSLCDHLWFGACFTEAVASTENTPMGISWWLLCAKFQMIVSLIFCCSPHYCMCCTSPMLLTRGNSRYASGMTALGSFSLNFVSRQFSDVQDWSVHYRQSLLSLTEIEMMESAPVFNGYCLKCCSFAIDINDHRNAYSVIAGSKSVKMPFLWVECAPSRSCAVLRCCKETNSPQLADVGLWTNLPGDRNTGAEVRDKCKNAKVIHLEWNLLWECVSDRCEWEEYFIFYCVCVCVRVCACVGC